jgi:hypothetical protein
MECQRSSECRCTAGPLDSATRFRAVVLFPAPGGSVRIRIFPASRTWGNNIHANDQERKLCVNHERNNQIETSTSRLHLKRYALMFSPQQFVDPLYTWKAGTLKQGKACFRFSFCGGRSLGSTPALGSPQTLSSIERKGSRGGKRRRGKDQR